MSRLLPELRPYQRDGIEFLQREEHAFLGDEAGLGKSRQLWEAARGDTLIVAPAMVLDGGNWADEVGNWPNPGADALTMPYSGLNLREKTGTTKSSSRPVLKLQPVVDRPFGTLILDEAHYVKNKNTTWTWAVRQIAKRADQVFLATGTPIPNWPHELFVPLQLLYPEDAKPGRKFGAYWRWVDEWFKTAPSRYSQYDRDILGLAACRPRCFDRPATNPCDHYVEFVAENLGSKFLQRLRDEVLPDLPPLTQLQIDVPMTPKQATAYRSMKREYLASIDGQEVVAWSAGAKNVMLDRLTTGLGVVTDDAPHIADSGKYQRLEFDLASRSRPTLVVAHYRASVWGAAQVAKKVGASAIVVDGSTSKSERLARVRAFQAGEVDVLCATLETIAEGLTLTSADMIIRLERSYKPSRNEQAARRIHRLGQTRPCTLLDYVAVLPTGGKTVDGNKLELLASKTDMQVRTLTAAQFATLL